LPPSYFSDVVGGRHKDTLVLGLVLFVPLPKPEWLVAWPTGLP